MNENKPDKVLDVKSRFGFFLYIHHSLNFHSILSRIRNSRFVTLFRQNQKPKTDSRIYERLKFLIKLYGGGNVINLVTIKESKHMVKYFIHKITTKNE